MMILWAHCFFPNCKHNTVGAFWHGFKYIFWFQKYICNIVLWFDVPIQYKMYWSKFDPCQDHDTCPVAGTWGSSQDPHSGISTTPKSNAALNHSSEVILPSEDISRPRVWSHTATQSRLDFGPNAPVTLLLYPLSRTDRGKLLRIAESVTRLYHLSRPEPTYS